MNPRKIVPLSKSSIFFALSLACCTVSYGQMKEDLVKNIRHTFQEINNDKTHTIVKLQNEEIRGEKTDGGEELTGYFDGDSIRKIYSWIGLSYGVKQYEYYFSNGQLIFVYETEKGFHVNDSLGSMDQTRLDLLFEGRYYLDKGKMIDRKTKGQKRFGEENSASFVQDMIARSKSLTKILRSRLR
jgi:hypothetical protein